MIIVFDMDNTLMDELGNSVRPGMIDLLNDLIDDGHTLILWSSSTRSRGRYLLHSQALDRYFSQAIFREDYDPHHNGLHKDIRMVNGDLLVDDDPDEIHFVKRIKRAGFLISPYRQHSNPPGQEIAALKKMIRKKTFIDWLLK